MLVRLALLLLGLVASANALRLPHPLGPSTRVNTAWVSAAGATIPCSAVLGVGPSNAASVPNVNNPRGVTFSRVKSLRVHTAAAARREKPQ
jgi:hypothetical protein